MTMTKMTKRMQAIAEKIGNRHQPRPLDEARTLPRAAYTSPGVFALEHRVLFGRLWLCLGREEDRRQVHRGPAHSRS